MPFVPIAAGVPMVFGGNLAPQPVLASGDTPGTLGSSIPTVPLWGIFLNGNVVVTADNVVSVEVKKDSNLPTYPTEQGGFQTYNKVQEPIEILITFSSGGSLQNRQALLDSIAAIEDDTNLYDVHTPEKFYSNMNVMHSSYERRSNNGAGLIKVDVWMQEIRQTVQASFTNSTSQPQDASVVNDGAVQTTPVTSTTSITNLFQGLM